MRTIGAVFLAVLCLIAVIPTGYSFPAEEPNTLFDELVAGSSDGVEAPNVRAKRATCDLLSFLKVNDAACAAHCIVKKYKGGYCNDKKVCVCRK
ncbi:defensin-C-like [Toxorhynchites rutilus septentrionalis]|uniref:defensin-C-like n=1 Tax=Toxorhynchites rutilus septentrionalis TaxID=329112 RepID=UPI00247A2D2D|nr:defensin-C-like [Toxorhynchites rutilus septentrionalis]